MKIFIVNMRRYADNCRFAKVYQMNYQKEVFPFMCLDILILFR